MNRTSITWCMAAALLTFGPVGLRMLSWERHSARTVDEASATAGAELFHHEWQPGDPLSSSGDGLGPVFNARSCVACHNQNGPGGSGGREHNVTLFRRSDGPEELRDGVILAEATDPKYLETLALLSPQLPPISRVELNQIVAVGGGVSTMTVPGNIRLAQRNTPALFGAKLIDEIPDRVIIAQERAESIRNGMASSDSETLPVGRALRLADGHVGRFGWKGQTARLGEFVQAACSNELGLGNPGHEQPRSLAAPGYRPRGMDLTQEQCDQLTDFVASLDRPIERLPDHREERSLARAGKSLFSNVGCADCHTPNLGSIDGLYSDMLLHRMGADLEGGGTSGYEGTPLPLSPRLILESDPSGPLPNEWRTPPLWGVADSAPYLHDGRAATLEEAINLHGGQGAASAKRFEQLSPNERGQLIDFLRTLRAF